jgi:hypothetical protein
MWGFVRTRLIFHNTVTERARRTAAGGARPANGAVAQAKLASRARNVKVFHGLIYHGIVRNSKVEIFHKRDFPRDML